MATVWLLPGCCLAATWLLPSCCLAAAWLLPGCCVVAAWLLSGCCLAAACCACLRMLAAHTSCCLFAASCWLPIVGGCLLAAWRALHGTYNACIFSHDTQRSHIQQGMPTCMMMHCAAADLHGNIPHFTPDVKRYKKSNRMRDGLALIKYHARYPKRNTDFNAKERTFF